MAVAAPIRHPRNRSRARVPRPLTAFVAWLALAAATLLLALLAPLPVLAASPVKLSTQIDDRVGVLGGDRSAVETALGNLEANGHVQLWLLIIPTTGDTNAPTYAAQTYSYNGFGGDDMLLVVAVNDHRYGWNTSPSTHPGVSDGEIDSLLSSTLDPNFRNNDYPGGIVAFANAFSDRLQAGSGPSEPASTPVEPIFTVGPGGGPVFPGNGPSGGGDMGPAIVILAAGLLLVGGVLVFAWWRQRQLLRLSAEERDRRTGQLAREANRLLIETDDGIRDATQELGFAEAEFDESDVAPFRAAIGQARNELKAAFEVRQKLDDGVPEDQPTKEQMLNEIVERSRRAAATIAEQHARLQSLRDLERTAPAALAALPDAIAALHARLPSAQAALESLQQYAPSSWAAVNGNLEEAGKRVATATDEVGKGTAALSATPPDGRGAAHSARAAQDAVTQAGALLDALEQQARAIADARGRIDSEIQAADADIAAARQALAAGLKDATLAGKLTSAEADLAGARTAAGSPTPDPIAALKSAQRAHAEADEVLAGIRAAGEQRARDQAAFEGSLASATTSYEQAQAFIATRRNGVHREARTRLAEAERHLEQARALAPTNLAGAAQEARLADRLADEAYALARDDFDDWNSGGPRGGRRSGNDAGAFLGGIILGGILSGGGRHGGWGGGGWGGTPWGSGGFGGGGWGGGGGGGFGGFGGGSGGGGGFGGGGGGGGGSGGGGGW